MGYSQWAEMPGVGFTPTGKTQDELNPGYYTLAAAEGQLFFQPVMTRTDDLLEFPDSASKIVLEGISTFWEREAIFKQYGVPFKRGILLYGPPGSGKTCTLQLVSQEVVERGGVAIEFHRDYFLPAYRAIRDIQPEIPIVVLLEDFESWMESSGARSRILNMLDGVERMHKVVFLATTNYPEALEPRVINRPSRFDVLVEVDHPTKENRRLYVKSLTHEGDDIDIDQYVVDTEGMSLAHLKELFISTHILGSNYSETIKRLRGMGLNKPSSVNDAGGYQGGQYI